MNIKINDKRSTRFRALMSAAKLRQNAVKDPEEMKRLARLICDLAINKAAMGQSFKSETDQIINLLDRLKASYGAE